jgi:WD40-like Beta Propeller Repeat
MTTTGFVSRIRRQLRRRAGLDVEQPDVRRAFGTKLAIANLDNGNLMPDLISEPGYEGEASPSPDGQWLALVTDRSGRPEVVLSRFVEDGARPLLNAQRLPVSSAGGVDPHWRADGHEIIYLAPDRTLMAASAIRPRGRVSFNLTAGALDLQG